MTKSPLKSKTIWGAMIALLPSVLPVFGLNLSPNDAVLLSDQVDAIIAICGTLLAIYGRVVAVKPLSL